MTELDDSKDRWIEIVYNELIETNTASIKSFNVYPRIVGISGHTLKPYDGNNFLKWQLKDLINRYFKVIKY